MQAYNQHWNMKKVGDIKIGMKYVTLDSPYEK